MWLVSIPIIVRFSDHWVTSEIESTWQPESARTASRVQISHPGEVLLSRDDDRSMKWTREWCTRGVCLSQLGITNTPECAWPWLCNSVCICAVCVCVCVQLYKKTWLFNSISKSKAKWLCYLLFRVSSTDLQQLKTMSLVRESEVTAIDCLLVYFVISFLLAIPGQQPVSQLWGLFWSFPIKHDPLPLILFATRSVTVILSTTNRLPQHTVKSTPRPCCNGLSRYHPLEICQQKMLPYLIPCKFVKEGRIAKWPVCESSTGEFL